MNLRKKNQPGKKQIEKLFGQMDNAYDKVQEIAMKVVSGKGQAYVPAKATEQPEN